MLTRFLCKIFGMEFITYRGNLLIAEGSYLWWCFVIMGRWCIFIEKIDNGGGLAKLGLAGCIAVTGGKNE